MECTLCPRECGIDRNEKNGFCGIGNKMRIAKIMLHKWEEPCICHGNGCGAVFFSGCQLQCIFCQNHSISFDAHGKDITSDELCQIFFDLEEKGVCNIDLVSPTPHLEQLIPAIKKAKARGLKIPFVYNSGGYEKTKTLKRLDGLIDIYMPDFKFFTEEESSALASAKDYAEKAKSAIFEMYRQTGSPLWENSILKRGILIRHLVLPGFTDSSERILEELFQMLGKDGCVLSLMRQYTPNHRALSHPTLKRKLTTLEYNRVVKKADSLGFSYVITQKKESADESFIPDFTVFSEDFR